MKKAESWKDVPKVIDERPAEAEYVAHGISRSISGKDVYVDFGNDADIPVAVLTFKDRPTAWKAYCKGIRLEVKVVEQPDLDT